MSHWQLVQLVTAMRPTGQKPVHKRHEAAIVRGFEQVRQLMHQYVLKALWRLLCEVCVEANETTYWIAAAPTGFHTLDEQL
jgi:hypothetical protein